MPNKLSDWKWCIDYSNAVGQQDDYIAPLLFSSREDARMYNKRLFPKGRIVKVKITILKK